MVHRYWEGAAMASRYAKYRPVAPDGLINRIVSYLKEKYRGQLVVAYDVGCGSGQSTQLFAKHFEEVIGTDLSPAQINKATELNTNPNVSFKVSPAEVIPEPDKSVQLISASQAAHWFDLPKLYDEGRRVLCRGGVMCFIGYELPKFVWNKDPRKESLLNGALMEFYNGDLAHYVLDPSREVYLGRYTASKFNIALGTEMLREESFYQDVETSVEDLVMLTTTWSGFNNFCKQNGDAEGTKLLNKYRERLMHILQVPTSPEETMFIKRTNFFALMARNSSGPAKKFFRRRLGDHGGD